MKILSAAQCQELDAYTMKNEPVSAAELMERASNAFSSRFVELVPLDAKAKVKVICGTGNNGGDGLVISRLLKTRGYDVTTCVISSEKKSAEFSAYERRLQHILSWQFISDDPSSLPEINPADILIDAIFGTGLSKPATGIYAAVIERMNASGARIFSVDIPSGMFCDLPKANDEKIVKADYTFTFHAPKLAFFLPSTGEYSNDFFILDIGLKKNKSEQLETPYYYLQLPDLIAGFKHKKKFGYKKYFGHACLCAGSKGMGGAAILTVSAALRSGTGVVTAHVPSILVEVMHNRNPEALELIDDNNNELGTVFDYEKYSAMGIGPGIGTSSTTASWMKKTLTGYKNPVVLDADALNILAADKEMFELVPPRSILTPHLGEFRKLFGEVKDDLERLNKAREQAAKWNIVIVLKGAHSAIVNSDGTVYFNSSGNPGMAKGGSGDVLTGLITGLLAQGYESFYAAKLGVYLHGLSGDLAAKQTTEYAMTPMDMIGQLGNAFRTITGQ
jgi:hydroxyethylthiazole kinase-like uncharacterized protein yjeF